jgi:carbonic anhydrase
VHNGHTIQVNHAGADTLEIVGEHYSLVQYHFHAPSEHTVNGRHYPMEAHFVHQAADGHLAVVGILLALGRPNPALEPMWSKMPRQKGGEVVLEELQVAMDDLLPRSRTAFRYEGSLTTPPCSEGVKWIVMSTPVEVSAEQIAAFRAVVHDNSRPTQPLNGRSVLTERVERAP